MRFHRKADGNRELLVPDYADDTLVLRHGAGQPARLCISVLASGGTKSVHVRLTRTQAIDLAIAIIEELAK